MKYETHGTMTIDQWKQMPSEDIALAMPLMLAVQATLDEVALREDFYLIPTMAGFLSVAGVYAAVPALVAADGPLPFGDAIAVGLLAIPDAVIFRLGYGLFD